MITPQQKTVRALINFHFKGSAIISGQHFQLPARLAKKYINIGYVVPVSDHRNDIERVYNINGKTFCLNIVKGKASWSVHYNSSMLKIA
jgi:hypothetical protein